MRVFLAVELGADEVARLSQLIAALKRRVETLAPDARVTWARPGGFHLTLHFLGDRTPLDVERAAAAFEAPLQTPAFDVCFGASGTFPLRGAPRVIWAGPSAPPRTGTSVPDPAVERLQRLHDETADRLQAAGLVIERKPFQPHVTLGRIRHAAGLDRRDLLSTVNATPLGMVHVAEVTLFESRLHPDGAEHAAIARTRLL